jgi:hypothetical protein
MPPSTSRRCYVERVLQLYHLVPGAHRGAGRADRRCAGELHDRNVPLDVVSAALVIAVARRTLRKGPPLDPIATLYYFRPVVDELLATPPEPGYISYVAHKLAAVAPELARAAEHQVP